MLARPCWFGSEPQMNSFLSGQGWISGLSGFTSLVCRHSEKSTVLAKVPSLGVMESGKFQFYCNKQVLWCGFVWPQSEVFSFAQLAQIISQLREMWDPSVRWKPLAWLHPLGLEGISELWHFLEALTHSALYFFSFKFIALKMWVLFSLLSFTQSPSWIIAASHSQSSSFSPSPAFSFTMYVCVCATLTWSEATGRRENKRCPSLTAAPLPTGCSHRPSVCVCGFPRTGDN